MTPLALVAIIWYIGDCVGILIPGGYWSVRFIAYWMR